MKRFLATLAVISLVGFGCVGGESVPTGGAVATSTDTRYENAQYGFALDYPRNIEARVREEDTRQTKYLGLDADFFLSIRDVDREDKATTLAYFYAIPGMTTDLFTSALTASNAEGAITVKSVEDVEINGVMMKKVVSTTELGSDKTHYLFDGNGTPVVVSVFLEEQEAFEPIFQSIERP